MLNVSAEHDNHVLHLKEIVDTYSDVSGNFLISNIDLHTDITIQLPTLNELSFFMEIKRLNTGIMFSLGDVEISLGETFVLTIDNTEYNIVSYESQADFVLSFEIRNNRLDLYQDGKFLQRIENILSTIDNFAIHENDVDIYQIVISQSTLSVLESIIGFQSYTRPDINYPVTVMIPNSIDLIDFSAWLESTNLNIQAIGLTDVSDVDNVELLDTFEITTGIAISEDNYVDLEINRESDTLAEFDFSNAIFINDRNFYYLDGNEMFMFIEFAPDINTVTKWQKLLKQMKSYTKYVFIHSFMDNNSNIIDANNVYNSGQYF